MGYVRSTPCPAIEVETVCPPFNIRCRWLAGKFILKSLSHSNHLIFDTYYSLYLNWRYVPKSMPVLSIIANSLSDFYQYIINSDKLFLYEQPYDSLLFSPPVQSGNHFSNLSSKDFRIMSYSAINAAFSNHLNAHFPNFIVIYTDGSVSPLSAGYAFYIPELHVSFTNNLPPSSSSFTAECYAIFEALTLILNFGPNNYLIASDSMSCLQALNSNPFNSHLSPLILRIKSLIFTLNQLNYTIHFLWIPSHIGILGNEVADNLAKSTSNLVCPSLTQLPSSDFTLFIKRYISNLWSVYWNNLPANFASRYKYITPNILKNTWFNDLNLPRSLIVQFNRLRMGHTLLPGHSYKLGLNDSPFCTLHLYECVCDLPHILFVCPALHGKRLILISSLQSLNIPFNLQSILNTKCKMTIKIIITFILEAGFVI